MSAMEKKSYKRGFITCHSNPSLSNCPTEEGKDVSGPVQVVDNQIFIYDDLRPDNVLDIIKAIQYLDADLSKEFKLRLQTHPTPIWLRIYSPGGDLYGAFSIVNQMQQCTVPVYTLVEGYAVSAAAIISIAGDKRFIKPNSFIMVHEFAGALYGSFSAFKEELRLQEMLFEQFSQHFVDHTLLAKAEIEEHFKQDWWLSAEDAKLIGMVDEIYE